MRTSTPGCSRSAACSASADERAGLGLRAGRHRSAPMPASSRPDCCGVRGTAVPRPASRAARRARSRSAPGATRSTSGSPCSMSWRTGSRRRGAAAAAERCITDAPSTPIAFELYRRHGLADADALRLESARYRSALGHAAALGVAGAAVALAEHRSRLRARPRRRWRVLVPEHAIRLERDGRWSVCAVCRQRVVGPNLRRVRSRAASRAPRADDRLVRRQTAAGTPRRSRASAAASDSRRTLSALRG